MKEAKGEEKISNEFKLRSGGDSYTLNFFNNRNTDCYGAKNCSKLVWCAYDIAARVDIDSNGGAGVYPRDILNYKYSKVYKEY